MNCKLVRIILTGLFVLGLVPMCDMKGWAWTDTPRPRWRLPGTPNVTSAYLERDRILYTSPTKVLVNNAVVNRKTGKILWRRDKSWKMVGLAEQGEERGAVVLEQYSYGDTRLDWVGLDLLTGKERWRVSVAQDALGRAAVEPLGVYGSVLAACTGGRHGHLQLRNVFTGTLLDPTDPADLQLIRQGARQFGACYDLAEAYADYGLVKLDPNAEMPIALDPIMPAHDGSAMPVGVEDGRAVVRIDEDSGDAGHSVWPKYLIGYSVMKHWLWKYPQYYLSGMDTFEASVVAHTRPRSKLPESQVTWAFIVPQANVVIAEDDPDWSDRVLCGIGLKNGRLLWKRSQSRGPLEGIVDGVAYGRGALVVTSSYSGRKDSHYSKLGYLRARTGSVRWLCRLPPCARLMIDGDDLFAAGHDGLVSVYSCRSLLGSSLSAAR